LSTYRKDRGCWYSDFRVNGKRGKSEPLKDAEGNLLTANTARGRKLADEAEAILKRAAKDEASRAPQQQGQAYALAQAFAALTPGWKRQGAASYANRQRYIAELSEFFGASTPLVDIDPDKILKYVNQCHNTPREHWTGGPKRDPRDPANERFWKTSATKRRSPATVNLYLATLRAALQHGTEQPDPVTKKPILERAPKVPWYEPPKRKARPVPINVAEEAFDLLPQHAQEALTLTLLFGFRRSECFELEIKNVDFDQGAIRLDAETVKDDEDAFLPGSPEAMAYLARLVEQARARGTMALVAYRPHRKDPVEQAKVAWRKIKRPRTCWARAMRIIEERHGRKYRWHDLRANFITHVMRTTGADAAQALARHSEFETTLAYIEVGDERRRTAARHITDRDAVKRMLAGAPGDTPSPSQATPNPVDGKRRLKLVASR